MEKQLKIYLKTDEAINELFMTQGVNYEILLENDEITVEREEVVLNNDSSTRGIITYLLLRFAESLIKELALKFGEKALDKIVDTSLERILKPILDFIKKNEPKKNITINVYVLAGKDGKSFTTISPNELSENTLKSLDKILVDIKTTAK